MAVARRFLREREQEAAILLGARGCRKRAPIAEPEFQPPPKPKARQSVRQSIQDLHAADTRASRDLHAAADQLRRRAFGKREQIR